MTPAKSCPPWQRALITQSAVIIGVIILGMLYWARSIIIPIAMALFFSYVLAPVVRFLSRRGLGHSVSVVMTVAFATCLFLGTSVIITRQITGLTASLTDNGDRIKAKIAMLRDSIGSESTMLRDAFDDLERTILGGVQEARQEPGQQAVVVAPSRPRWMSSIDQVIGPITEAFGMAAFSFLLVVFILLARDDLKDRLLRLIGNGSVSNTTRALDDATTRLSQYLLAQLTLNVVFGVVIALVMWCLGLKYALLWGFIATLMRYVPYIGSWIGMIFPALFSFATCEPNSLWQPIAVLGFYGVLELLCGNVIEPFLYGPKLGVSEVAQLVSAAFWSFLWGPIGLILSGPISSCLVVLGRHSPRFHFFEILLGSEPPLAPEVALFQRLMTSDSDDAMRVVEKHTPKENPVQVFDSLIVPTLIHVKNAIHTGEFTAEEIQTLVASTREVVVNALEAIKPEEETATAEEQCRLLMIPARDAADQLAADIVADLLNPSKWKIEMLGIDTLAAEMIERVVEFKPDVICIASLPPAGLVQVRYLCKRLRQNHHDVRILVGRWGDVPGAEGYSELLGVGATAVEEKIEASLAELASWRPLVEAEIPGAKKSALRPALGTHGATTSAVVS